MKAIAHAHVKTDKIDAGMLASLHAAGYLPEIWTPDAGDRAAAAAGGAAQPGRPAPHPDQERGARDPARAPDPAAARTPICSTGRGRAWLARQALPDDERAAIDRHLRELDRLGEDLAVLDREIAQGAIDDPSVKRLLTITGVNLTVAAGLMAAIGDIAPLHQRRRSW